MERVRPSKRDTQYRVPALERAAAVLDAVNRSPKGLKAAEIARAVDLPRSSTHILLTTMESLGLLRRDPDNALLTLGIKLYEWGLGYERQMDLITEFNRMARELVAQCRETVQLAVLDGREVIYLAKQEPASQVLRLVSEPGKRLPAQATALGKVMLAHLPVSEVLARYQDATWPAATPRTITSLPALLDCLRSVREQRYAWDRQEIAEGLECVAAPILDQSGQCIAALSISCPTYRLSDERRQELTAVVRSGAEELSRRSGFGIR